MLRHPWRNGNAPAPDTHILGSTPGECQAFFNYFVASFLLCCPCEALEGPISTRVGIILTTTLIQSRHIINKNSLLYNEINSQQSKLFKYTKIACRVYVHKKGKGSEVSLRR